jgi:hypothetical protein
MRSSASLCEVQLPFKSSYHLVVVAVAGGTTLGNIDWRARAVYDNYNANCHYKLRINGRIKLAESENK